MLDGLYVNVCFMLYAVCCMRYLCVRSGRTTRVVQRESVPESEYMKQASGAILASE